MQTISNQHKVIIIGAGAAGLFCAAQAAQRGRQVLVVDHAGRIGGKIPLTGGGLCNFTNRKVTAGHYLSNNPHFCKSALAGFTPADFLALMEQAGISYEERELGRLFCRDSAFPLVEMLTRRCQSPQVTFMLNCPIERVEHAEKQFCLHTPRGPITTKSLVIATGGQSYPQANASNWGLQLARQLGLQVIEPRPGLVPLQFSPSDKKTLAPLSGIALKAQVALEGRRFQENVLFTHQGLSGPAILQISSYWTEGKTLTIDWLPGRNLLALLLEQKQQRGSVGLKGLLYPLLPNRMAQTWIDAYAPARPLAEWSKGQLEAFAAAVNAWPFTPAGTAGWGKAEVMLGGVDTRELSSQTMEARRIPGLYFIGEVVDVTGQLGGYNLHWAWASATAAGKHA